jgi:hypothetical protein
LKGFGGFLSKIRHFARNRTIVQKIEREWLFAFNVDRGLKADVHFGLEVASFGGASARRLLEECRAGVQGSRGWGGERVRVSRGGFGGGVPGTRWDFLRDRVAVIRYVARLFPIP